MVKHTKVLSLAIVALTLLLMGTSFTPQAKSDGGITLIGAGDIASCASEGDEETAKLVERYPDSVVATFGDNAYENGTEEDYENCYEPTWGRFKDRTYPAVGNHDYGEDGYEGMAYGKYDPSAYFDYFDSRAGERDKGWYSYDLGGWHIVVLNSNCDMGIDCDPYSEQLKWLSDDLSKTDARCILAYWHHPLYSSGYHGDDPKMRAAWNVLYGYGADVVLNGHEHNYERFAPQDPYGNLTPRGIREFIVGTGGKSLRAPTTEKLNSEALSNQSYGVLKLDLKDGGYDWEFLPVDGGFHDSGSDSCH